MLDNILLMTDSYKVSHYRQYPPGTEFVFSYLEARTGGVGDEVTFFGLQYIIDRYLTGLVVTREKIDEAEELFAAHFHNKDLFNREGWEYILRQHNGRLPVIIKAVPEGTTIPTGNVLMTIENTDPNCFWLVNYLETLLVQVWYPTTVCTNSRDMKKNIRGAMDKTGADLAGLPFKLHDFGYRGSTSAESAAIGGAAHLVNFLGTDTFAGIEMTRKFYGADMAGFSIPAAEHSTITSWGRENEAEAYRNMLTQYPTGLVAVVSDSYDIYNAVANIWGGTLRPEVMNRNGTVVIRPDSGDPVAVIRQLLTTLWNKFGGTTNEKGYRTLHSHVRLIQGDGIDSEMLSLSLEMMVAEKWSIDNIAFGSGGGLLQKVNRDTYRFAMKCSAIQVNGEWRDVYKDPLDGNKASKSGRLILLDHEFAGLVTAQEGEGENLLKTVFIDGHTPGMQTLSEIRERAAL